MFGGFYILFMFERNQNSDDPLVVLFLFRTPSIELWLPNSAASLWAVRPETGIWRPMHMFEVDPSRRRLFRLRRQNSETALRSDKRDSNTLKDVSVRAAQHLAGLAVIVVLTLFYRRTGLVNDTTVGFSFLLVILCASTIWGLSVALFMSVAAALTYDFFFLPPVGVFNISDPRDWVALFSFFVTAAIGAYLSAWARREAWTANQRRDETERLYDFSRRLLEMGEQTGLLDAIRRHVVESFDTGPVDLVLVDSGEVHDAALDPTQTDHNGAEILAARASLSEKPERMVHVVPLRTHDQELGSLNVSEPAPSERTLEAVGALIVVAIERARAIERAARMEAARKTEQLKSVLLDALAHDFKTPLTSIKGSATALLADLGFGREERKELLTLIDEECDQINKLITSAAEMARLEAGQVKLVLAPHPLGELVAAALADCQAVLRERRIDLEIKDRECSALVDLSLAKKVLIHLIDNANLYSSPGEPITVRAWQDDGRAAFSVSDRGPGVEEAELGRIFEKFYRGKGQRDRVEGTGMGLAIAAAIVRAHEGTIEASSQPGQGSVFTFHLPICVPTPR